VTDPRNTANRARLRLGDSRGHYESYFLRANHPTRPLAFWIRYTALLPRGRPAEACGELWAVFFDGERGKATAVKERHPIGDCAFSPDRLEVRIGTASLEDGGLRGTSRYGAHTIGWALQYELRDPPLLLLPEGLYEGGFPKAKSLVPAPHAVFRGALEVDGQVVEVDGWPGSQNHNWGSRHTERYAWGQVAGFDEAPAAFLECASARVRVGPVLLPFLTVLMLRIDGEELRLNALTTGALARVRLRDLHWELDTARAGVRVRARFEAARETLVALRYDDPPGGVKTCLNSKLARCELELERPGRPLLRLSSQHRAAFEILTDELPAGMRHAL
jgi:hypothetical protein